MGRRERCASFGVTAGRPPSRAGCEFRRRLADAGLHAGTVSEHNATPHRRRPFRRQPPKALVRDSRGAVHTRAHQRLGSYRPARRNTTAAPNPAVIGRPDRLLRQRRRDLSAPNATVAAVAPRCRRTGRSERSPIQYRSYAGAGRTGAVFDRRAHRVGAANRDGLHTCRRRTRCQVSVAPVTPVSTVTNCCRHGEPRVWCSTHRWRRYQPRAASLPGSGARDNCALKWAILLHGHELLDISPLQARCGWAVGCGRTCSFGRAASGARKTNQDSLCLVNMAIIVKTPKSD